MTIGRGDICLQVTALFALFGFTVACSNISGTNNNYIAIISVQALSVIGIIKIDDFQLVRQIYIGQWD